MAGRLPDTMRAAVVTAPGAIEVRDLPRPTPADAAAGAGTEPAYAAVVEILYGSVCPGTDTHLLHAHPPFDGWVSHPLVLGHESVGRVVEVGDLVTRVGTPGVGGVSAGWGGFAQDGLATDWRSMEEDGRPEADRAGATVDQVLPADADPAAATMFITWRETLSYLTRTDFGARDSLLVVGSGVNALAFANHARNAGAAAIGRVASATREPLARRLGVTAFADDRDHDAAATLLGDRPAGFTLSIDVVGSAATAALAQSRVADGGTLGVSRLDDSEGLALPLGGGPGTWTMSRRGHGETEAYAEVLRRFGDGTLDAGGFLDLANPFPLEKIADALAAVRDRSVLKPLIRIGR